MEKLNQVARQDIEKLKEIRSNIRSFLAEASTLHDSPSSILLDIAPQDYQGAKEFFKHCTIETLDIDVKSGASYITDICKNNSGIIADSSFDIIVCTEVLEHTLNPFDAIKEISRILKPTGLLLASTPFNFRIHGPLPDCWRFSEHGIRALMSHGNMKLVELKQVDDKERFLMPIHYTYKARKL